MFQIAMRMTDADSSNDLTGEGESLLAAAVQLLDAIEKVHEPEPEWTATLMERLAALLRAGEGEVTEWDFSAPEYGYVLKIHEGQENFVTLYADG